MVLQALPMISLVAPFFAVFVISHLDYRKIYHELQRERREVSNMSIPNQPTDLSVEDRNSEYVKEVLSGQDPKNDLEQFDQFVEELIADGKV